MDEAAQTDTQPPVGNAKARGDMLDARAVAAKPDAMRLGRLAHRPADIPWSGWKRVIKRTAREVITDRISLCAAGCAFYATLALFPAISMLVSLYGLVFDPQTVGPQLAVLRDLLPPSAYQLIADRVQMLVSKPPGTLTFSLLVSICIALWSSATGTKSILGALNLAYEERETRSFLRFQLTALGMTLGGIVAAVIGLASLVVLPAFIAFFGISTYGAIIARIGSLGALVVFVLLALSLLYRFGPSRRAAGWHWITPGSAVATPALGDRLHPVLILCGSPCQLRRDLRAARRRGRRDDVVLRQRAGRADRRGAERGAGAADRARQHGRAGAAYRRAWRLCGRPCRALTCRPAEAPASAVASSGASATSIASAGETSASVTSPTPRDTMPSLAAAARDRSMQRIPWGGSRSFTRTMTEVPLDCRVTRTSVPSGSVAWAAVSLRESKRSPLEVRSPSWRRPYQLA